LAQTCPQIKETKKFLENKTGFSGSTLDGAPLRQTDQWDFLANVLRWQRRRKRQNVQPPCGQPAIYLKPAPAKNLKHLLRFERKYVSNCSMRRIMLTPVINRDGSFDKCRSVYI
jgi:hypothetical protein